MGTLKKTLALFALATGVVLSCTASVLNIDDPTAKVETVKAVETAVAPAIEKTANGDAQVTDPGTLETFVPTTGIAGTIMLGLYYIVKMWRDGKQIDVDSAKTRAEDAERRTAEAEKRINEEIGKAHTRVQEAEKERDEAYREADRLRAETNEHKEDFYKRRYQQFQDHRTEIDAMVEDHERAEKRLHSAYIMELSTRRKREALLTQNGIPFEDCPPPYTKQVAKSVTMGDIMEAQETLNTTDLPIIDSEQSE